MELLLRKPLTGSPDRLVRPGYAKLSKIFAGGEYALQCTFVLRRYDCRVNNPIDQRSTIVLYGIALSLTVHGGAQFNNIKVSARDPKGLSQPLSRGV